MYKTINPLIYVQLIVFFFWLYPSFESEGLYSWWGKPFICCNNDSYLYHYFVYFLYVSLLLSIIFYFWKLCNVKPGKNSIFRKNGKTVILVKNWKFSKSRMTKQTSPLNSYREI